jgi:hypothetical protein
MKKESIIRQLKENKKYIALFVIASILTTAILIPIMFVINEQKSLNILYQKSRDGIFIEDKFLERGESIDYGGAIGYMVKWGDAFYFDFLVKDGDWVHIHFLTGNNSFRLNVQITHWDGNILHGIVNLVSSSGYYTISSELMWTGIYRATIYNWDPNYSGYLTLFLIVHNQYYPPECPLE